VTAAYLSLGTNMGEREDNLRLAIQALLRLPQTKVTATSYVYETEPGGGIAQPDFYNMTAKIETGLSPRCLLGALLGIEAAIGRVRKEKNGPRVIDIDLLLYGDEVYSDEELTIPHKEMFDREFVLAPLAEICDKLIDRANVSPTQVKRLKIKIL